MKFKHFLYSIIIIALFTSAEMFCPTPKKDMFTHLAMIFRPEVIVINEKLSTCPFSKGFAHGFAALHEGICIVHEIYTEVLSYPKPDPDFVQFVDGVLNGCAFRKATDSNNCRNVDIDFQSGDHNKQYSEGKKVVQYISENPLCPIEVLMGPVTLALSQIINKKSSDDKIFINAAPIALVAGFKTACNTRKTIAMEPPLCLETWTGDAQRTLQEYFKKSLNEQTYLSPALVPRAAVIADACRLDWAAKMHDDFIAGLTAQAPILLSGPAARLKKGSKKKSSTPQLKVTTEAVAASESAALSLVAELEAEKAVKNAMQKQKQITRETALAKAKASSEAARIKQLTRQQAAKTKAAEEHKAAQRTKQAAAKKQKKSQAKKAYVLATSDACSLEASSTSPSTCVVESSPKSPADTKTTFIKESSSPDLAREFFQENTPTHTLPKEESAPEKYYQFVPWWFPHNLTPVGPLELVRNAEQAKQFHDYFVSLGEEKGRAEYPCKECRNEYIKNVLAEKFMLNSKKNLREWGSAGNPYFIKPPPLNLLEDQISFSAGQINGFLSAQAEDPETTTENTIQACKLFLHRGFKGGEAEYAKNKDNPKYISTALSRIMGIFTKIESACSEKSPPMNILKMAQTNIFKTYSEYKPKEGELEEECMLASNLNLTALIPLIMMQNIHGNIGNIAGFLNAKQEFEAKK